MKKLHKKLYLLQPTDILFDIENPRGLTEEQILHAPAFKQLLSSIKEHGILEPLIIKADPSRDGKFILIDGERRLRAALKAEGSEVPALLAKNDTDGRILAYQVHMLRENWDKAAETKAIKKIIKDLTEEKSDITELELKKKIREITGHTSEEINDLFRLLKYHDDIIEKVLKNELHMSYLIQIEQSFLPHLEKNYKELFDKFGEHGIREIMVNKAIDGNLVNTRFLMDKFKEVFADTKNKAEIERMILRFLQDKEMSIKEIYDKQQKLLKGTRGGRGAIKTGSKAKDLSDKKRLAKNILFMPKQIKVSKKEQTHIEDIREKIEKIGGIFLKPEYEYISEALFCLEKHCFKAAILMVWSTGISRILNHLESNLLEFNKATEEMRRNKKSVWKHFADNFQRNISTADDLRVLSNDIQLLCYLVYRNIITVTQFNALRGNYQTRCDCAHPTDVELSPNTTLSIFENIYNYILFNANLK